MSTFERKLEKVAGVALGLLLASGVLAMLVHIEKIIFVLTGKPS